MKNGGSIQRKLKTVLARLEKAYKRPVWKRWGSAVNVLVETILSQNTNNANSQAGYRHLRRRFRTWNAVALAPTGEIEKCIRVSGLSRIKAPRIKRILGQIKADRGRIDLEFLRDLPPERAYKYLLSFDGVGPKTANCTLLFSLSMPVFPVDTHIHRIARRLGVIGRKISAEKCQDIMAPLIAPPDRYAMHILLITHGRAICHARNPNCPWCCLDDICPSAAKESKARNLSRGRQ